MKQKGEPRKDEEVEKVCGYGVFRCGEIGGIWSRFFLCGV